MYLHIDTRTFEEIDRVTKPSHIIITEQLILKNIHH